MPEIVTGGPIAEETGDALVVAATSGPDFGTASEMVASLGDWVAEYLADAEFTGKAGQVAKVPGGGSGYKSVVFAGLGDDVDKDVLRRAAGNGGALVTKAARVVTNLHSVDVPGAAEAVAEGFLLGQYSYDDFRAEKKTAHTEHLVLSGATDEQVEEADRGRVIAEGVALARDLVNRPSGSKPPAWMADQAAAMAAATGLRIDVYDETQIARERFGGLAGVNAGSVHPARMVVLWHEPEGAEKFLVLVGKGIVFDTGGISIKPAAGMEEMKTDMSGAAAVFGAMQAIARLGLPIKVAGIAPLTENMPSGSATRPGDILTARNGKTIEVINTDAEGRLVLADGLSLAAEWDPDFVVDIATLTGACKVALGDHIAGVWGNEADTEEVLAAGRDAGERLWPMPLPDDYRTNMDSDVADIKNTASARWGGAINAAMFLKDFIGDHRWAHIDIAGPARAPKDEGHIRKGGTGFGVSTMVALAERLAAGSE